MNCTYARKYDDASAARFAQINDMYTTYRTEKA